MGLQRKQTKTEREKGGNGVSMREGGGWESILELEGLGKRKRALQRERGKREGEEGERERGELWGNESTSNGARIEIGGHHIWFQVQVCRVELMNACWGKGKDEMYSSSAVGTVE